MSEPAARGAFAALLHPVSLLALAIWIVNDHYAKAAHGGVITGKLSDVACLVVVPLIPLAALELWRARHKLPPPGVAWTRFWLFATGFVMATINLFDWAAWCYRYGLATAQWPFRALGSFVHGHGFPAIQPVDLTMDPTDLLALPALVVPWLLLRRPSRSRRKFADIGPRVTGTLDRAPQ